jgi:hypothetical protein
MREHHAYLALVRCVSQRFAPLPEKPEISNKGINSVRASIPGGYL